MRWITEYRDEPVYLLSMAAIIGTAVWGLFYAGRGRSGRRSLRGSRAVPVPMTSGRPARGPSFTEARVPDVSFDDVAGVDEALEELQELKDYLLDPERFCAVGATLPRGVLLVGPPGTGKTLLTKALAGEAQVPFQVVSAASLVEVYVGVGPARIRQIFADARKKAPSIVLIDELDAIGRTRSTHASGGQEERESTLNQLLLEMDGFEPAEGVLIVGATNRPDVLDTALLRPGRFDRRLVIAPPDMRGRRGILAIHARGKPLGPDVDLDGIARRTVGFTGADLANVLNEAALLTGRRHKTSLGSEEIEEAIDRLMSGPRRPSRVISPSEKRVIAYHEAGHVLVARCLARGLDVQRVSIVARGQSHGHTLSVPTEDRVLVTRTELLGQLAVLMGGRVAEELVFADPTTGSADDLARATALAGRMVRDYGMTDRVGLIALRSGSDEVADAGDPYSDPPSHGIGLEATAEVRRLLKQAYAQAAETVKEHRHHLDVLATRLVASESLEKADIDDLLAGVPGLGSHGVDPAGEGLSRAAYGNHGGSSARPGTTPRVFTRPFAFR